MRLCQALLGSPNLYLNDDCLHAGLNEGALETVMQLPPLVLQALAFAVDYLKPFGMEAVLQMSNSFRPFNTRQEMALSANTLTCAHPSRLASRCSCWRIPIQLGIRAAGDIVKPNSMAQCRGRWNTA